jgi:hypothetical protein
MASRCSLKGISAMPINFRIFALVPVGLIVESVAQLDDSILVTVNQLGVPTPIGELSY